MYISAKKRATSSKSKASSAASAAPWPNSKLPTAIEEELKTPFSHSYPSQIESGSQPHLTNTSRMLLAKFFKAHSGCLVDDPEGYFISALPMPHWGGLDKIDNTL